MKQFTDKVALVTGAGSGMGRATALLLADRGAAVTVVGRRADRLDHVVKQIEDAGGQALAVPGDVSSGWNRARAEWALDQRAASWRVPRQAEEGVGPGPAVDRRQRREVPPGRREPGSPFRASA